MTESEAVEQLKVVKYKYEGDNEMLHIEADEVLIEFLKANGFNKLAKKYNELEKLGFWYT